MSRQIINNTPQDSGLGDSLYVATTKLNQMTEELYAADASFADEIEAINSLINGGIDTLNHQHTISQIIGLQTALSGKVSTSTFNTQILAINSSIQAINTTLSEIIDILNTKIGDAPFSGITYGRRDGAWVQITGGTPSGDYVPYTGATKDVDLGANDLYLRGIYSNWGEPGQGVFWVNTQAGNPYILFGDGREIGGENISVSMQIGTDNGHNFAYTNSTNGNTTTVDIKDNFVIESLSNIDMGNLYVTPIEVSTNKKMVAAEGFEVYPFLGSANNRAEFGTSYGGDPNIRQIFFRNDGDGVNFTTGQSISFSANIEEGIAYNVASDAQRSDFQLGFGGINMQVTDGINTNNVQITNIQTSSSKKVFTDEGFEGNYVQFNTGATETSLPGKMYWNDTQGTINIGLKGGETTVKSGVDLVVRIVNKVSPNTTLTKAAYQAVRVSGAQGQRLAIELAQANNDNNSADTIGLVCETIAPNQEGFIMTVGQLEGINTTGSLQGESWSDGDVLYLSPTTAGRLTNVKPVAPGHIVVMGYVEYAHSQNGKIYVKVMNGWELDELHNVNVSSATNGQVLTYSASTQTWVPRTPSTVITALSGLTDVTISSGVTTGSTLMWSGSRWNNINPFDYYEAKPVAYSKTVNMPVWANAGHNNIEGVTFSIQNPVGRNWTDTNIVTRTQRLGMTGNTTGTVGGQFRQIILHFSRNSGFSVTSGFNMAENANDTGIRFFMGIRNSIGTWANVEPDTLINIIGVCRLSTSNNLHLLHNDGTGTATTIDLGSNFPANTVSTDKYVFVIETVPTGVYFRLERVGTSFVYERIITSDLPAADLGMVFGGYIVDTAGANTLTGMDWYGTYVRV